MHAAVEVRFRIVSNCYCLSLLSFFATNYTCASNCFESQLTRRLQGAQRRTEAMASRLREVRTFAVAREQVRTPARASDFG
jgi:hypothetical protein